GSSSASRDGIRRRRASGSWLLPLWVLVVGVGLAGRDGQPFPALAAQGPGEEDDLPDVVARVRHRTLQRVQHGQVLAADDDGAGQIVVRERGQGPEEHVPALFPLRTHLVRRDRAPRELRFAIAPWLLAVRREEVGEAGPQVAGDVPHDRGHGVPVPRWLANQRFRVELADRLVSEALVAAVFGFDGGENGAHGASLQMYLRRRGRRRDRKRRRRAQVRTRGRPGGPTTIHPGGAPPTRPGAPGPTPRGGPPRSGGGGRWWRSRDRRRRAAGPRTRGAGSARRRSSRPGIPRHAGTGRRRGCP